MHLARKDDDAKDFGKEAIEILLKEMTDEDDMAVIAAGYPDEMDNFINSNPGLKSRFNVFLILPITSLKNCSNCRILCR